MLSVQELRILIRQYGLIMCLIMLLHYFILYFFVANPYFQLSIAFLFRVPTKITMSLSEVMSRLFVDLTNTCQGQHSYHQHHYTYSTTITKNFSLITFVYTKVGDAANRLHYL